MGVTITVAECISGKWGSWSRVWEGSFEIGLRFDFLFEDSILGVMDDVFGNLVGQESEK